MKFVVKRSGGQSEVARQLALMLGRQVKPQTIQYLCEGKKAKLPQGSRFTPQIAVIGRVHSEWLASGNGPRDLSDAPQMSQRFSKAAEMLATLFDRLKPQEKRDVWPHIVRMLAHGAAILKKYSEYPGENQSETPGKAIKQAKARKVQRGIIDEHRGTLKRDPRNPIRKVQ